MLLNILQYTGQPPTTKNYLVQNVNSVEAEKLWLRISAITMTKRKEYDLFFLPAQDILALCGVSFFQLHEDGAVGGREASPHVLLGDTPCFMHRIKQKNKLQHNRNSPCS